MYYHIYYVSKFTTLCDDVISLFTLATIRPLSNQRDKTQRLFTERFDLVNQPRKSIDVSVWNEISTVKRLDELPADVPDLSVILPAR